MTQDKTLTHAGIQQTRGAGVCVCDGITKQPLILKRLALLPAESTKLVLDSRAKKPGNRESKELWLDKKVTLRGPVWGSRLSPTGVSEDGPAWFNITGWQDVRHVDCS